MINLGCVYAPISLLIMLDNLFLSIRDDNVKGMIEEMKYPISVHTKFRKDDLSSDIFENLEDIMKHSPPLISVAAFFSSLKCFETLLSLGADIRTKDDILQFFITMLFQFTSRVFRKIYQYSLTL